MALTPPIGTRGRYTVKAPFMTDDGVIYTCSALRRFIDLENLGTRIYETYYAPFDLAQADMEQDRRDGVLMVTLTSESHAPLYIPTSYITSFPDLSYRNYQHVVMSASLGPLPDYIDLTFARQQMQNVISDVTGVATEVFLSIAPMSDTVTPDEHEALEAAREASINNRTTDYARTLDKDQKIQRLEARNAVLVEILRSNGLLPE